VIPDARMEWTPEERKRPLADLGFHVFRLSLGFIEASDRGDFPASVHAETAPADLRTGGRARPLRGLRARADLRMVRGRGR